jgi:hypothetical protein
LWLALPDRRARYGMDVRDRVIDEQLPTRTVAFLSVCRELFVMREDTLNRKLRGGGCVRLTRGEEL